MYERSLQLLETMGQKVVANLQLLQASITMLSVVLSAMVFFPLGTITSISNGECMLFSKLYISVQGTQVSNQSIIDLENTHYGSGSECDYTTFMSVTVGIAGIILLWFLVHSGEISDCDGSEVAFLLFILFFYIVLFICALISSLKITSGFLYWCDNLMVCYNTQDPSKCVQLACTVFSDITLVDLTRTTSKFYVYFELAQISSWLLTLTLLLECVLTFQRIFQNVKATIIWEEKIAKTTPSNIPQPPNAGIVNLGSDEYLGNANAGQVNEGQEPDKQTLADVTAEVTVHQENVTIGPTGSYEMSAIRDESAAQIVSEKGVKQRKKNQNQPSNEIEKDNDKTVKA